MPNRLVKLLTDPSELPRSIKRFIMVVSDSVMVPLALWSAFALRLGEVQPEISLSFWVFLQLPLFSIFIFARLGLYRAVVRFMGSQALMAIFKGVTISTLILAALVFLSGDAGVPRSVLLIYWGVLLIYIGGSRFVMRGYFQALRNYRSGAPKVVIYGAGSSGIQLANALMTSHEYVPVAFMDDDKNKVGAIIHGLKVFQPSSIQELLNTYHFSHVLLAMPGATRARRHAIVEELEKFSIQVLTVPSMSELLSGSARIDEIRGIDVEDLLGRDVVRPNQEILGMCIRGKVVMVTGAGGSIGSELCRQALELEPKQLLLYEQSEHQLYLIDRELRKRLNQDNSKVQIISLLGDVADRERLRKVFAAFQVQTIYHAAAYKHVPLVEQNPLAGIQNNIYGTLHLAREAQAAGVEHFMLISTDKAVNPTNIMGASKRMAEMVLQGLNSQNQQTVFSMVRFGNVLGSSGSVVPLFRQQILEGGPLTVTHPDVVRYFMTISEAVQLVIQAGTLAKGGDVFVLDMGKAVKILDLATRMIRLSGLEVRNETYPDGDIEISFIGLRPGEKLFEELLIGDNVTETEHPKIMRAEEEAMEWADLQEQLDDLTAAMNDSDIPRVREILRYVTKGYQPPGGIEDYVWCSSKRAGN